MGSVFGCHQDSKKPRGEARVCVGWAIDQRRRRVPSIAFRILLMTKAPEGWLDSLHAKGLRLFRTVAAMCRANGIKP